MALHVSNLLVQWILPEPHGTPEGDVGLLGVENFRSVLDPETCLKRTLIFFAPINRAFSVHSFVGGATSYFTP